MTSALVLAHGAAGTVRGNFGPMMPALSRILPVAGPDFPGSADTPRATGALRLDDLTDQLVDTAGQADTFMIVGYSMGCAVAVRAAIRFPERVTGLVLTAGAPRADREVVERLDRWQQLMALGEPTALARFVLSVISSDRFLTALPATQVRDLVELVQLTIPPGTAEQLDLVRRIDVTADLAHVAVPTLVIGARHDRLIPPAAVRRYADGIPGARWAELDCGHAVALEAAADWLHLVEAFITEVRDGTPVH
jgi:pimeloyl-ACP methyl ester carboxylesterase